jgi:hypothetical protein
MADSIDCLLSPRRPNAAKSCAWTDASSGNVNLPPSAEELASESDGKFPEPRREKRLNIVAIKISYKIFAYRKSVAKIEKAESFSAPPGS